LTEVVRYSNFSSEKFTEIFTRMATSVKDIKVKEEYQNFAEKNK
jgi:hypothetical protein